jgi:hypothetical protein
VIFGYSFDNEISFSVSIVLEDYNYLGMSLQILRCQTDFGDFLVVAARSIILAKFIPIVTSTTMVIRRLPSDVDQTVWLLFFGMLVMLLLSMLIDYFNGCARARSLGIAAQIQI